MSNLNNMTGIPMGGQQPPQRQQFSMGFQNQLGTGNPNPGPIDYTWQNSINRETRDNVIKTL